MLKYVFKQAHRDHTLFISSVDHLVDVLIVYVYDIILTGNNDSGIQRIKRQLASEFELKDQGQLKYFLGMEVARTSQGLCISQRKCSAPS